MMAVQTTYEIIPERLILFLYPSEMVMNLECEYPEEHECTGQVTAKIGVPSSKALWVCENAFWLWRQLKGEERVPN